MKRPESRTSVLSIQFRQKKKRKTKHITVDMLRKSTKCMINELRHLEPGNRKQKVVWLA